MVVIESPIKARLIGYENKLPYLEAQLTYTNLAINYEIKRLKNSPWILQKLGQEAFDEQLKRLEAERKKSLLFEDEDGYWTYSGLAQKVAQVTHDQIVSKIEYPEPRLIPWEKIPFKLRDYQEKAVEVLLQAKHGAIEFATGAGKSLCLLYVAKALGLKTVVLTPSISIADQMHKLFLTHFGKKYVGKFYQGKKEVKLFTIAVAASLVRLDEDEELFQEISKTQVLLADEAHLLAAETLSKLCFGLFAQTPYRFFVSGTQIRNDGLGLLLEGIIGPVKSKLTVKDLVDKSVLAKPEFFIVEIESPDIKKFRNTNDATRHHVYYNQDVNRYAADIANKAVAKNKQVLILIEEIEHFNHLLPHLKHQTKFVYGSGSSKAVPELYRIKNITEIVNEFNSKTFPILVGTSSVSTGTDFTTVDVIIYLMGGQSEIQVRQSVGRGTRRSPGKERCFFFDFDIVNIDSLHRHAKIRQKIYQDIIGEVKYVNK